MNKRLSRAILALILLQLTVGCTPVVIKPGPIIDAARLTDRAFITEDGASLTLSSWRPEHVKAVLIALHGFNDYRHFFAEPGDYFKQNGIVCYAYDQRGFGANARRGYWAGVETYADDLTQFVHLVKQRHPDLPIYLLGESMGGAVIINAMSRPMKPRVAGVILAAPAVWGRTTMPWYQSALLWGLSHTFPWLTLTGEGLDIVPSDNIDMLINLGKDPLIIKETRVDAIHGLANLMDQALANADSLDDRTLLLYGEKDEIVPREPTRLFLQRLLTSHPDDKTIAYYEYGYHMLLRDLQAPVLWLDIVDWIASADRSLPSGADRRAQKLLTPDSLLTKRPASPTGMTSNQPKVDPFQPQSSAGQLLNSM